MQLQNMPAGPSGGNPTMSSREIAELVDSRHDKVKQSIERLVARGVIGLPPLGQEQENATTPTGGRRNYAVSVYRLCKRDSYIVVAQLSPEFTARLVDRWEELERKARQPSAINYSDPAVVLGFIGHLQAEVAKKDEVIAALAPKADALDRIAMADGSLCISDAAKTLQKPPRETFKFMRTHGWIFRRLGANHDVGYSDKLKAGLLEHKTTTVERSDGSEKVVTQVRVTPKGLVRLAEALGMGPMQ